LSFTDARLGQSDTSSPCALSPWIALAIGANVASSMFA
jgi:hypothetical protein